MELLPVTAIVFNSRNTIDHFFRIAEEVRFRPSADMKYFCITEAVALYLQKYIQYRKRKVFYGNGSEKSLQDLMMKHRNNESFLLPCSNVSSDYEFFEKNKFKFQRGVVYRTVSNNVKDLKIENFDLIVFFTPAGIKSLFENFPKFNQGNIAIGAFGDKAHEAAKKAGLRIDIQAPTPQAASMPKAIELFIESHK